MSYTDASQELDEIVRFFEQREVDVDELVTRLERATAIVEELDKRLRRTRVHVEQLVPRLTAVLHESTADAEGAEPRSEHSEHSERSLGEDDGSVSEPAGSAGRRRTPGPADPDTPELF